MTIFTVNIILFDHVKGLDFPVYYVVQLGKIYDNRIDAVNAATAEMTLYPTATGFVIYPPHAPAPHKLNDLDGLFWNAKAPKKPWQ